MQGVSVVVCCYNSASRIRLALEYLSKQKTAAGLQWEIILVNNNSSDNTAEIATRIWQSLRSETALYIIDEPKAGLSNARKAGVKAANYDIILFCDDDNWLSNDYVYRGYRLISSQQNIGAVGGSSTAWNETNYFPEWFKDCQGTFAVGKQAKSSGDVTYLKSLWGAGLITRKDLYLKAFSATPSLLTDRKETALSSGGDSEYCSRLVLMNYRLYYDEDLRFIHFTPESKLTEQYKENLSRGFQESHPVLFMYYLMIFVCELSFLKKLILLFKSIIRFFLSHFQIMKRLSVTHEKTVIYFLTGINGIRVSPEAKFIYQFARQQRK